MHTKIGNKTYMRDNAGRFMTDLKIDIKRGIRDGYSLTVRACKGKTLSNRSTRELR